MDTLSPCGGLMDAESKSAAELRKQNKPLMEKRRRARINESLNKLKSLVLDAMKRDTSRYSKLEKADILEMTVKHLRAVQRQQMSVAMATDTTVISKYRAGFVECASEVTRYLSTIDGLDPQVRNRLMSHLSGCTQKVTTISAMQEASQQQQQQQHPAQQHPLMTPMRVQIPSATPISGLPGSGYGSGSPPSSTASFPLSVSPPMNGGFHMMPGSLPGGQFALLVPSADGGYALSATSAAGAAMYRNQNYMNNTNTSRAQTASSCGGSLSTSPDVTSPMSLTSPGSDHVFRYGSDAGSCSSDEEEVEVALDMRVEPCRDVNANVIVLKPGTSQSHGYQRNSGSPGSGSVGSSVNHHIHSQRRLAENQRSGLIAQHAQQQGVKVEDMWRPW